ncbi:HAMP domain-containing sensor histidine kinase [Streptomyces sp. G-G2]|uniref:HAMP domain-containing sensor histidine kinase n=1 Tax=Streptomyces sp. G-G2 TaxID=3046201 RepID=UPI0024B99D86|nr:HAMP domain-containing sensor histidine kinase [Streptomyces sp. G-G2]MDJ0383530.1 HAMP domain-containing sensor histidine kinase [Streptomyces sp. G-G2]
MRQRVVRVAVAAVLVALVLLAGPLAAVVQRSFFEAERGALERTALAATVAVGPEFSAGDAVELPRPRPGGRLGVYDLAVRLRAGTGGPSGDPVTRRAVGGKVTRGSSGDDLVVAVPVVSAEQVIGVVRASVPARTVWNRVLWAWALLLAVTLLALATAVLVARRQARSLSAPVEALSRTATEIADGDLGARAGPCGIAELDQLARTQNDMVERLTHLLRRERDFSANASHQLRTPLTGLQLGLEAAQKLPPGRDLRPAVREALERVRHLEETIAEVLRLARSGSGEEQPVPREPLDRVLDRARARWHGEFAAAGRRLEFRSSPGSEPFDVAGRTTAQILDVLLDNALRHGRGTAAVAMRETAGAVAVDVADEGTLALAPGAVFTRGSTTGPGSGIGLAMARELAEAAGGRLSLRSPAPTTFTLLLPGPGD